VAKKEKEKISKTEKAPKADKAAKKAAPKKAAASEEAVAQPAPAEGKKKKGSGDGTSVVVVESPAKERTIGKFLGKGFVVKSSYGHVRDLPEKKMGVDEENDFEPTYVVLPRAKKILPELTKACEKASQVFLATDHDREGESIAWHLVELLKLKQDKVRRITFTEITPGAIQDAIKAPRMIDGNLVSAQQARRILDRLVGYKLSPLLWQKVRRGLSAGRVQSAAVRLLAERHKEIQAFQSETYWTLTIGAEKEGIKFPARLLQWKGEKIERTQTFQLFAEEYKIKLTSFRTRESLDEIVNQLSGNKVKVTRVEAKTVSRRPSPPFATSTLQQEASRELGFSSDRTMRIAQQLYEGVHLGEKEDVGLITYMRTDSFNVSKTAQEEARRFLKESYGDAYLPEESPTYATKSRGAQEAHEAIRPTSVYRRPDDIKAYLTPEQYRVYHLIWRRFLASQMTEAQFDTVSADLEKGEALFRATGRTLKFDGFLKLYREEDEENENVLPPLVEGDQLPVVEVLPEEHQSSPPPNYNEASLIRALERHGIGRPSTYAPIVKTIVDRGYAQRGLKDKKLTATELGLTVTDKLKEHFPEVVSLEYTSEVEERLDEIAEGSVEWHEVLRKFYAPFRKALDKAYKEMAKIEPKQTEEKCPKCGELMLLRESRFGKYLSCPRFPKCRGKIPLNAEGQKIQPQTTEEKCPECGKPMLIRFGRRGRFMACTGYPACKVTFSVDAEGKKVAASRPIPTDRPCNKCNSPLWLRSGKRGYFLACSAYPKCRNIVSIAQDEAEAIAVAKGVPPAAPAAAAAPPSGDGAEASSEAPKPEKADGAGE
jgi:DNA topoisomerase-1